MNSTPAPDSQENRKPFVEIPTKLTEPIPPDENLPPEEYAKAMEEYERAMKEYWREYTYGANYEENPAYQKRRPYWDNEWEATKYLIL